MDPYGPINHAGNTYSITLNGVAKVQAGKEAERYRALHLQNNQVWLDGCLVMGHAHAHTHSPFLSFFSFV